MADQSSLNLVSLLGVLGVGGLIGSFVQSWLTDRRDAATRRVQFRTRQLQEFYGPLLSLRREIKARSELRVKIQGASYKISGHMAAGGEDIRSGLVKIVTDENETLKNVLMPLYHQMTRVFRENMWLAEPETRDYFPALIEFVDVWDKILTEALPRAVASGIGHTEDNLQPFYSHLEATHDRLRAQLDT